MPEDEVEIEADEEEYEVVPLSPIRKLEKRIDELEEQRQTGDMRGLVREVMDLVKSNQQMVDEIVKSNNELRRELEKIPEKVDQVLDQWEEFLEILEEGEKTVSSGGEGVPQDFSEKLGKLIEQNSSLLESNQELVDSMKSFKRGMRGSSSVSKSRSKNPKLRIKRNE
jgi:uncharacterized coiled-coil DUF342 family protein